jgi:hypothetical protein
MAFVVKGLFRVSLAGSEEITYKSIYNPILSGLAIK